MIHIADGKQANKISSDTLLMAIGWCGYLEKHARRIYGMINNAAYQSASKLAKKIQQGELSSPFSVRDIYRKEWTMLDEKRLCKKPVMNWWKWTGYVLNSNLMNKAAKITNLCPQS